MEPMVYANEDVMFNGNQLLQQRIFVRHFSPRIHLHVSPLARRASPS